MAEDGAARHEDVGTRDGGQGRRRGIDAAIHLDVHRERPPHGRPI